MKDIIVDEITDMFFAQKSLYEKANETYKDPKEKIIYFGFDKYKDCDIKYGEFCPHHHCVYTSLILESGKTAYFKCGRKQNENC